MNTLLIFYDGYCPFCKRAMASIKKHDRRGRIKGLSFRNPEVMKSYDLADRNVENRIYVWHRDENKGYSGIHAILEIAKQIPLYWVLVPPIKFSILIGIGDRLYDFIAKRRTVIPTGKCRLSQAIVGRNFYD